MSQSSGVKRVPVNFFVIAMIAFAALVILSPGRVTTLISNAVPAIYEGAPCANLRIADDRAGG